MNILYALPAIPSLLPFPTTLEGCFLPVPLRAVALSVLRIRAVLDYLPAVDTGGNLASALSFITFVGGFRGATCCLHSGSAFISFCCPLHFGWTIGFTIEYYYQDSDGGAPLHYHLYKAFSPLRIFYVSCKTCLRSLGLSSWFHDALQVYFHTYILPVEGLGLPTTHAFLPLCRGSTISTTSFQYIFRKTFSFRFTLSSSLLRAFLPSPLRVPFPSPDACYPSHLYNVLFLLCGRVGVRRRGFTRLLVLPVDFPVLVTPF